MKPAEPATSNMDQPSALGAHSIIALPDAMHKFLNNLRVAQVVVAMPISGFCAYYVRLYFSYSASYPSAHSAAIPAALIPSIVAAVITTFAILAFRTAVRKNPRATPIFPDLLVAVVWVVVVLAEIVILRIFAWYGLDPIQRYLTIVHICLGVIEVSLASIALGIVLSKKYAGGEGGGPQGTFAAYVQPIAPHNGRISSPTPTAMSQDYLGTSTFGSTSPPPQMMYTVRQ